jgi:hypothetical protein
MAHAQIALCRTQGNSTREVKMNLVTDNILLAQSIVSNPLEIASYLRRLARRRPAVCFHPRNGVTVSHQRLVSRGHSKANVWIM